MCKAGQYRERVICRGYWYGKFYFIQNLPLFIDIFYSKHFQYKAVNLCKDDDITILGDYILKQFITGIRRECKHLLGREKSATASSHC